MSLHLQDTRIGSLFHAVSLLVVVCCCSAVTVQKPAPFCILISSEQRSSQVSFLIHSSDTSASPLFYWSKWTSEKRLEGCFRSSDGTLVARYRSLCRQERARDDEKPMHFISALLEDASLCQMNMHINFTLHKEDIYQGQQMDSRAKSRQKRAWVFTGTLWCGRGTSDSDYEQLGMFVHTDRCCRDHDHCELIIRSFSVDFSVFNPTLFTLSHCDCDRR
ncbi:group 3 secretory phospholipase A2-like [Carassius carassius]|uniref:group 3 secretory phospholipase A2-like n=1 Tax=Carassius carassius TaxID=217509 RepID=UPI002868F750|nr:group 3 secretory phospholipase A2-like [Carassius carassius]